MTKKEMKFRFWDKEDRLMIYEVKTRHAGVNPMRTVKYKKYEWLADMFQQMAAYPKIIIPLQYIGLKDKNRKEIYEGDIVEGICSDNPRFVCAGLEQNDKMGKRVRGQIKYSETFCQFYFTTDDITHLDLKFGLTNIEVLGNIYKDHDLLI